MDIKLKNKDLKLASFVLAICLITISLSASFSFLIKSGGTSYLTFKTYFNSAQFNNSVYDFFNSFVNYNITNKNYANKSIDEKISPEEVQRLKKGYDDELKNTLQSIENQYNGEIDEAEKNGNKDRLNRLIEERNKKLEDTKKENTKTIEDVKNELAARSDAEYKNLKKTFESMSDVKYYIKSTKNDEVYSNLSYPYKVQEYIKDNSLYYLSFPGGSYKTPPLLTVNSQFSDLSLEGYIIIPKGGTHAYNYSQFNKGRLVALLQLLAIFLCSAAGLYLLKYSKKSGIEQHRFLNASKNLYHKIPFDVRLLVLLGALLMAPELYGDKSIFQSEWTGLNLDFIIALLFTSILTFYFYISIPEALKNIRNKDSFKGQIESGLSYRFREAAFKGFREKNILFKSFIVLIGVLLLCFITFVSFNAEPEPTTFFIVIYTTVLTTFILFKVAALDKIIKGTTEIVSGNLNYVIKEKGSGNFAKLAHNINNMKLGISKAVENQMKSDRLKSELITNVSHDLKTPLTSIINYVDLLKREELTKEDMQDYIGVLDRKTQRLKVLIEDLFEASKMASGAVELNIEKVDVAQLLTQSLAELDEKIKISSLIFRVNIPHHKVYANLDGKKTWRVFENLIGNILKYSQPNTRVYIELIEDDSNIIITMKNISAYEMDFNVEEIFERFKRGDASRTTEGSGLGLAIAKSIVDIQGGKLNIETDGDLFKVIIEFKK